MPIINIPPYGPVRFSDTLSEEELRKKIDAVRAKGEQEQAQAYKFDPREALSLGQQFTGGAKRALSGIGSLVTDVVPAIGGSLFGFENYAREQMAEAAEKRRAAELESPTAYRKLGDIRGVGDVPGFLAETLGEGAVDIASLLVPGGVGSVVGRRIAQRGAAEAGEQIAKRLASREAAMATGPQDVRALAETATRRLAPAATREGAELGFKTGVRGGAYGLASGEIFQSVEEETGKLEPVLALTLGVPFAALDSLLPETIAKQLGATGKALLTKEMLERSTLPVAKSLSARLATALPAVVAKEGLTESAQENISILAEQIAGSNKKFFDPENVDRILMAGVKGGIAGGVFGAPSTIAEAARNKRTDQALIDAEQARRDEVATKELEQQRARAEEAERVATTPLGETASIFQEGEAPAPLKEQKLESFLSDIAKQKVAKPAEAPTEEGIEKPNPITQKFLSESGIVSGPLVKEFKNKDLNDPEVVGDFREVLKQRAADPKLSERTRALAAKKLEALPIAGQGTLDLPISIGDPRVAERMEQEKLEAAERKAQEEEQRRAAEEKRERDKALLQELLRRSKESQATTPTEDRETGPFNLQLTQQLENALTQLQRREAFERAEREAAAKKEEEIRKAEAQRGAQEQLRIAGLTDEGFLSEPTKEAEDVTEPTVTTSGESVPVSGRPTEGEPTGRTEPPVTAGVERVEPSTKAPVRGEKAPQGAVKEEPKAGARIERKESFRGRTTPDVTYIVYDQDGNRSQTFNKKADAQQHLDLLTLSREDFLNKYPNIRTKVEAVEAEQKKLAEKTEPKKEPPSAPKTTETQQAKEEGAAKTTKRTEVAESATDELTDQEQSAIQAELDEQQAQSEVSKVKKARGKRRQKEAEATEKGEPPPAKEKKVKKAKAEKAAEPSKPVPDDAGETAYKKYMALSLANRKRVAKEFGLTVEQVADREIYFTDPAGMEEVIALVQRRAEGKGNVEFEQLGMVNPIVPFNVEAGYLNFAPLDIPQQLTTEIEAAKGSAENDKVAGLEASLANVNADVEKVKALVAEQKPATPEARAAKTYFSKMPRLIDGLINIAWGNEFETPHMLPQTTQADPYGTTVEANFFQGMTRDNAALALTWVNNNLSNDTRNALIAERAAFNRAAELPDSVIGSLMTITSKAIRGVKADALTTEYFTTFDRERSATNRLNLALEQAGVSREDRQKIIALATRKVVSTKTSVMIPIGKGDNPKYVESWEFNTLNGDDLIRVIPEKNQEAINDAIDNAGKGARNALARHYGVASDSQELLSRTLLDAFKYLNKGAQAVEKAIRKIIKEVLNGAKAGLLSIGLLFNPGQLADVFSYNPVKVYNETVEIKATVPQEARGKMSGMAIQVYESMAPAAKASGKGFMIADKPMGMLHVFDTDGNVISQDTALYGRDYGDVLDGDKRVTPAGKYTLKMAPSTYKGGKAFELVESTHRIGDTDYVIAVHAAWLGDKTEKREQRLASQDFGDKRISYGCINTKHDTFLNKVLPNADKLDGGMVFVLPDNMTLSDTLFKPMTKTVQRTVQQGKALRGPTLGEPLHPAIVGCLQNDDLPSALKALASYDGMIGKVAGALVRANIDTSVKVVEGLTDESGRAVAGFYDPQTDTIFLDSKTGLNSHVALHEALHAATSHVLDNPSHPITKQLQALYGKVKGSLDTAYGATSLDEFVAEAFSNPEFQAKLQAIFPDGKPINAWTRFTRMVSNMLRSLMRQQVLPTESAFDQVDRLVSDILSPAPASRDAGALFAIAAQPKKLDAFIDTTVKVANALGAKKETGYKIDEFLRNSASGYMRKFLAQFMPLHVVTDLAAKYLPKAREINTLINQRAGEEEKVYQLIEPVVTRVEKWGSKAGSTKVEAFNKLVYGSTVSRIDVGARYDDKLKRDVVPTEADYKTPEEKAKFRELKAIYDSLGADGQKMYRDARDVYRKLYQYILDSLTGRIDDTVKDPEAAKKIKQTILEKLAKKGGIDPYFPLTREGKYWLSYETKDANGQTDFVVEAFAQEKARKDRIAELEKQGKITKTPQGEPNVNTFSQLSELDYRRVPSTSFVSSVLSAVPEESRNKVLQLFVDVMPETAFAKSFQTRKDTPGYIEDAIGTLRKKAFPIARQVANMKYAAKLEATMDDIDQAIRTQQAKPKGDVPMETYYRDILDQHVKFAINPNTSRAAQLLSTLGFNMTLGFNVSSALVNLGQVPIIVTPYLAGEYQKLGGMPVVMKEINEAYKLFLGSGFKRNVPTIVGDVEVNRTSMPSMDNYNFDAPSTKPEVKRLKILAQIAAEHGMLNRSQIYDTLEAVDDASIVTKVNKLSGIMMHQGERMNRQVTMIAAYNLELAKMKKEGRTIDDAAMTEAANRAIYLTELTNGGIAAAAAPLIAQKSAIGRLAFMFKRYGVSMYYLLFKAARTALSGEDKPTRIAAMKQVGYIAGMTALTAGISGLPLFGAISMLYSAFKDDDEEDLESIVRRGAGELAYKGLLNYTTGLEIASRMGLSDLIMRDVINENEKTLPVRLLEAFGGPVYGTFTKFERGVDQLKDGHYYRGIETMMPSALANGLRSFRFATEGANTLRGDPIIGDISPFGIGAQLLGFAPADYTRQLEINSVVKGIDKAITDEKTKLLKRYYLATRMGDVDERMEVRDDLVALARKYPGMFKEGVEASIQRSMAQHRRTTKEMYAGITLSKGMRDELLELAREYED